MQENPGVREFSVSNVNRVVDSLLAAGTGDARGRWLASVASRVCHARPDLAAALAEVLGVAAPCDGGALLEQLTIGEVGVCYEAFLAASDPAARRAAGQFFTPDDVAAFMARQMTGFPEGRWLDPCCGVGNLSWHLAGMASDPAEFVRSQLTMIDADETALRTAVALVGAEHLKQGDARGLQMLWRRCAVRDFLTPQDLPDHDYVIANPPYARAPQRPDCETAATGNLFAYFMEKIAKSARGFVLVTPASFLCGPSFQPLRDLLEREVAGGDVLVFDNVPDTLFRGYKHGSNNTSKTNFVRAAITVARPGSHGWQVSPVIRWKAQSRARMLEGAQQLLARRRLGPYGEWVKLLDELGEVWASLSAAPQRLSDLVVKDETDFSLTVATTPRYYISASYKPLERASKAVLFFANDADRDRAAVVLNSDIAYLWWRGLDGGVTLPKRVLMSTPIPTFEVPADLVAELRDGEGQAVTTKLNAGRVNENVKRDRHLVGRLNRAIFGEDIPTRRLYAADLFAGGLHA